VWRNEARISKGRRPFDPRREKVGASASDAPSREEGGVDRQAGLQGAIRIGHADGHREDQVLPVLLRLHIAWSEFGAIILRANPDGSTVRLRDVARPPDARSAWL